jgi:hypothetical protein
LRKGNQSKAFLAATFWRDRGREFFQSALRGDPGPLLKLIGAQNKFGGICDGIFVSRDGDIFTLLSVQIVVKTDGSKIPTIEARINPPYSVGVDGAMGNSKDLVS